MQVTKKKQRTGLSVQELKRIDLRGEAFDHVESKM
jgi:hypothetical protein